MIPYGKQEISQADVDSVVRVLKSDFITQGPQVPLFEQKVANYCGANFGVSTNSATSALHIACLSLDLGKGDWLWTSPNSFVASANCALYCGAKVDFVDIDSKTYNLSVEALEKKLIQAEIENRLPKVLVPVHFAGQSCDMKRIHFLGRKYGFRIIEDASHAIGGKYLDKLIGGCQYSDITIFSFHPVKIVTTAEGGLAVTNNSVLAERMQLLRSHGVTRDSDLMTKPPEGDWYYQQVDLGFNYRMTDLQAALGVSQMEKVDAFIAKRHTLSYRYDNLLSDKVIKPYQSLDCYSSLHLYPIQVGIDLDRKNVFNKLRSDGIGVNVHYIPIYTHPYYNKFGFKEEEFPNTKAYYSQAISLPIFAGLDFKMQDQIIHAVNRALSIT